MSQFMEIAAEDKARGRVVRETALVESEWPAHSPAGITSQSGYATPTSGSGQVLLAIPSGKWYKPRTLIVTNANTTQNCVYFYEGGSASACSAIMLPPIFIDAKNTVFIALDGITAGKDIWMQADAASAIARIGGILIASLEEN